MNKKARKAAAEQVKEIELLREQVKSLEEQLEMANIQKKAQRRARMVRIAEALFFAVISMTTSLSIAFAVPLWVAAGGFVVYAILDALPYTHNWRLVRKLATCVLVILLGLSMFRKDIKARYTREVAAATSGFLAASKPSKWATPVIEFGDSGKVYTWRPTDEPLRLLSDAGLSLKTGENGIEVSTTIRDQFGNRIAWIEGNHWYVDPRWAADKNFTDDALEVLDSGGHVVLQIRLLSDRVQMRGEWHDKFGRGAEISDCTITGHVTGCVSKFGPGWPEETNATTINPLFEYPSDEHLGEFHKAR